ncbi:hypothetical protein CK203_023169 [Vitis vinifera]|uniref:Reverse transcriptase domain-containing protein n=1 Tax=Vitis vinifera TaxID=29760 RepID=A0A438J1R8_VITVI|nr:hypothetical protein CK203_023169 [Vitis vinifera]
MAKVLANRLMRVLNKVVAPTQNAFVMGRQILDASLIANEVIDSWQKRKEKGLISKFSVLVNGVPAGFFPSSKGLRQGDPLSPYLFVLEWKAPNTLSWILLWFEVASGLRINLDKSEIIPVGVVEEIEEMVVELGCRVGSLPSQYLGLPLGAPKKPLQFGDGVEEKDKSKGGLGLRKLVLLNKALLGKWIWRFAYDKDNLWKQVITVKYGQEGHGWRAKRAHGAFGVGVWKEIWKETDWELATCSEGLQPFMEEDSVCWKGGRNGKFRVKEAYRLVARPNDFGWIQYQPRLHSMLGRLHGGGCSLLIDFRKEDGVQWVFPETVKEVLTSWRGPFVERKGKDMEIHTVVYFLDGLEGKK